MGTIFSDLVRRGALWSVGGNMFSTIVTFASGVILARLLSPSDFGVFMATTVFTSILLMLSKFGLPQALIQAENLTEDTINGALAVTTTLSLVSFLLLNASAPLIAQLYGTPEVVDTVRFMSPVLLLSPIPTVGIALLRRAMQFDVVTKITAVSLLASAAVSITLAMMGFGPLALAIGSLTNVLATLVLVLRSSMWKPRLRSLLRVSPIIGYSRFMALSTFLVYATNKVDNLLVGALAGMGSLGNYGRAFSLSRIPLDQFAQSISPLMLGSLSRLQRDASAGKHLFSKAIAVVSLLTFPFFALLFVIGPQLVVLVYGAQWSTAAEALRPFVVAASIMLYYIQLQSYISAFGLVRKLSSAHFLGLIATVFLVLSLAPFGLFAIGVGIAIREAVILSAMLFLLRKTPVEVKPLELIYTTAPALAATAAATMFGFYASSRLQSAQPDSILLEIIVTSIVLALAYAGTTLLLILLWRSHTQLQSVRRHLASGLRTVIRRPHKGVDHESDQRRWLPRAGTPTGIRRGSG